MNFVTRKDLVSEALKLEQAIRHREAGVRIGELSLAPSFDGVLSWGLLDNRPFLRCRHGYGISLWRLGRPDEAARVFECALWMDPSDNPGTRCLIADARAGRPWRPDGA